MIRALKPTKVKRLLLRQAKEDQIYLTQVKSCRKIRTHVWILEPEASRRVKEFTSATAPSNVAPENVDADGGIYG